jgi:hypothetical protein
VADSYCFIEGIPSLSWEAFYEQAVVWRMENDGRRRNCKAASHRWILFRAGAVVGEATAAFSALRRASAAGPWRGRAGFRIGHDVEQWAAALRKRQKT